MLRPGARFRWREMSSPDGFGPFAQCIAGKMPETDPGSLFCKFQPKALDSSLSDIGPDAFLNGQKLPIYISALHLKLRSGAARKRGKREFNSVNFFLFRNRNIIYLRWISVNFRCDSSSLPQASFRLTKALQQK
jgi:hypothetical protein